MYITAWILHSLRELMLRVMFATLAAIKMRKEIAQSHRVLIGSYNVLPKSLEKLKKRAEEYNRIKPWWCRKLVIKDVGEKDETN